MDMTMSGCTMMSSLMANGSINCRHRSNRKPDQVSRSILMLLLYFLIKEVTMFLFILFLMLLLSMPHIKESLSNHACKELQDFGNPANATAHYWDVYGA